MAEFLLLGVFCDVDIFMMFMFGDIFTLTFTFTFTFGGPITEPPQITSQKLFNFFFVPLDLKLDLGFFLLFLVGVASSS